MATKNKFYAYIIPSLKIKGIAGSWAACEKIVSGIAGARYRGFSNREEAGQWLESGARYDAKPAKKLKEGIYFDAGTGRGNGVEISVTDEKGKNLLHKALAAKELNRFGKHRVDRVSATNNYGELLALRYALIVADHDGVKNIFGDSKLVIDYWSRWRMKKKELPEETVRLAHEVAEMRDAFEKNGGVIERISGAHNPADLGFHR